MAAPRIGCLMQVIHGWIPPEGIRRDLCKEYIDFSLIEAMCARELGVQHDRPIFAQQIRRKQIDQPPI